MTGRHSHNWGNFKASALVKDIASEALHWKYKMVKPQIICLQVISKLILFLLLVPLWSSD